VKLSEEANDPEINIPRGLVLAMSASIILYILVAISAVSVLGWEELSRSSAPFSDIARYALGPNASAIISMRYKKPQIARPFRVPFSLGKLAVLPVLGILFNLLMLTQLETRVIAIGLGLGYLGAIAAFLSLRFVKSGLKNK